MTAREERQMIRAVLAGDRAAAEALVRAHQGSLYAYMLRMTGRPEVAEDVVQEAFFRALTHLNRYDDRFRFSTWLFTIAKRLYVNANQRLAPAFDTDVVASASERGGGVAEDAGEARENSGTVRDALAVGLAALSRDQREAVVLFYQLGWAIEQIAEYLDQPEGTIKSHLHRARAKMREVIEASVVHGGRVKEMLA
jgi:RNA polymerase sigma-70 factor (ECF subfamily)